MSRYLNNLRADGATIWLKEKNVAGTLSRIPMIQFGSGRHAARTKNSIKQLLIPGAVLAYGNHVFGPVDGHDIEG